MTKTGNILLSLILIAFTNSCYKEVVVMPGDGLKDWSEETHSNKFTPNYSIVFPQNAVNRIDIVIDNDDWSRMLDDLTDNIGEFGSGSSMPTPVAAIPPPNGGGGMPLDDNATSDFTPIFKPASVFFNGTEWYYVGIRFKGNSSLKSTWQSGNMKLSLRFDFDEFENKYPEITDQRFYGFQKLAFSNNYDDPSFMHEKLAADIFRNANIKAPQTAYYRVYIDYGEGAKYFGLYTAVEIVENTMLSDQFGNNTGNCYKPEGEAATFAEGSFNTDDFEKKTNEAIADWSDVEALYNILNSSTRTSNTETWKQDLEEIFDVDNFLNWLATNTVIQNWDTYGKMTHNFYLYNDPSTNKIVWIPWDNNEALTSNKSPLSFSMSEVESNWPLIRYLLDIPEYETKYNNYLNSTIQNAFEPTSIKEKYLYYSNLIEQYVIGDEGEINGYTFLDSDNSFFNAIEAQNEHVDSRYSATITYLNK